MRTKPFKSQRFTVVPSPISFFCDHQEIMTVKEPDEVNVTHPDHQNQQLIVAYFGQENARKIYQHPASFRTLETTDAVKTDALYD